MPLNSKTKKYMNRSPLVVLISNCVASLSSVYTAILKGMVVTLETGENCFHSLNFLMMAPYYD